MSSIETHSCTGGAAFATVAAAPRAVTTAIASMTIMRGMAVLLSLGDMTPLTVAWAANGGLKRS